MMMGRPPQPHPGAAALFQLFQQFLIVPFTVFDSSFQNYLNNLSKIKLLTILYNLLFPRSSPLERWIRNSPLGIVLSIRS
uniref:Uncharacterized protein n=1 Tax=Octopus bimaculoides TaxID=37653 RepID=A0A0L8HJU8_OCTBM